MILRETEAEDIDVDVPSVVCECGAEKYVRVGLKNVTEKYFFEWNIYVERGALGY